MRIALLEDDEFQANALIVWLEAVGHEVGSWQTCADFRTALEKESFDLLILDWILPDGSGLDVLDWIRKQMNWQTPVLFVTQRDKEEDVVTALQHGADDYMAKPVKPLEMLARITALARRAQSQGQITDIYEFGPYKLNSTTRSVEWGGRKVDLTHKEFDLTLFLFRNLGRLISRGKLLESVWGTSADLNTRTVDTHISRIRNKLGLSPENGWKLSAVYQHGYRLERLEQPSRDIEH